MVSVIILLCFLAAIVHAQGWKVLELESECGKVATRNVMIPNPIRFATDKLKNGKDDRIIRTEFAGYSDDKKGEKWSIMVTCAYQGLNQTIRADLARWIDNKDILEPAFDFKKKEVYYHRKAKIVNVDNSSISILCQLGRTDDAAKCM